jgi:GcrA cell cycle regulator
MTDWTQEETAIVIQLAGDGHSAGQIAAAMITKSRNAVIGKLHRMGVELSSRLHNGPKKEGFTIKREKKQYNPILGKRFESVRNNNDNDIIPEDGKLLFDLEQHECRWPFGETNNFKFCGHLKTPGSSYCFDHYWLSRRAQ